MQGNPTRYTLIAIVLHWLIALLIALMFALGWYMTDLPEGPDRSWYFALHKSIGLSIFALVVVRLAWRVRHPPPPLPAHFARWRAATAHATHRLLYLLMFFQPISGYLSSSFSGYKTRFFGVPLPHWGWRDEALNELLSGIHEASSVLLITLILLHFTGALAHLFKPGDRTFGRMLPGNGK